LLEIDTPSTPRGTLGRDAEQYYRAVRDLRSFVARRSEVRAWIAALGAQIRRSAITPADIRKARGRWLEAGVAPKTINNRVFSLQHLYRTLDGKRYTTPCDELDPLPVHRRPAVRIPDVLIRAIEAEMRAKEERGQLRDPKTRARFMLLAATGKRPSEIGRAQPGDVDLDRRIWIPRDGKGGFCPGVYLNDDMLEAWKLFIGAEAWGLFDSGSFAKRIHAAGLPSHLSPYQLRHTVGIALSEAGIDLKDIGDHLGHKRIETTRRHYVPVLATRLQKLSEALNDRQLGWKADRSDLGAQCGTMEKAKADK
jgi:integrase